MDANACFCCVVQIEFLIILGSWGWLSLSSLHLLRSGTRCLIKYPPLRMLHAIARYAGYGDTSEYDQSSQYQYGGQTEAAGYSNGGRAAGAYSNYDGYASNNAAAYAEGEGYDQHGYPTAGAQHGWQEHEQPAEEGYGGQGSADATQHEPYDTQVAFAAPATPAFGTLQHPMHAARQRAAVAGRGASSEATGQVKPPPQLQPASEEDDAAGDDVEYEDLEDDAYAQYAQGGDTGEVFYGAEELEAENNGEDDDDGDEDGNATPFFDFHDDQAETTDYYNAEPTTLSPVRNDMRIDEMEVGTTGDELEGDDIPEQQGGADWEDHETARRRSLLHQKMEEERQLLAQLEAQRAQLRKQMEVCGKLSSIVCQPLSMPSHRLGICTFVDGFGVAMAFRLTRKLKRSACKKWSRQRKPSLHARKRLTCANWKSR